MTRANETIPTRIGNFLPNIKDRHGNFKFSELFQSPYFYLGLILKLIFIVSFSSGYITELFHPVLEHIHNNGLKDFYNHFSNILPNAFPYPPLMLLIIGAPTTFLKLIGLGSTPLISGIIIKCIILLFDIVGLIILYRWAKEKAYYVLLLYWLSPLCLFVNYGFGQLDCIPTSLAICALYFLFKRNNVLAFVLLGLATATKTHIVILLPFFLLFHFRISNTLLKSLLYTLASILIFLIACIPFLNQNFINMVFMNEAQKRALSLKITYGDELNLYIVPFVIIILGIYTALQKRLSKDTLIMLIGFTFGCILLFSHPSVGWNIWIIPFLGYFFIKRKGKSWILFLSFQAVSILLFFTEMSVNNLENLFLFGHRVNFEVNHFFNDILFTFSKALLLTSCVWVYMKGISLFSKKLLYSKPILVGIAGDSGVGKSTLADSVRKVFGKMNTTILAGDDMHRWKRGDENWSQFTHLNPKANQLYEEFHFLNALKQGTQISRRRYDHDKGSFLNATTVDPRPLVLFEGLHSFFLEQVRGLYDLKIYVSPDEELRREWKITRDVNVRGKERSQAIQQIEERISDGKSFISPQQEYADLIISISKKDQTFEYKFILSNTFDILPFVESLENLDESNFSYKHWFESSRQTIRCSGNLTPNSIEKIRNTFLSELDDLGAVEIDWSKGSLILPQLIVSYLILYKVRSSNESIS